MGQEQLPDKDWLSQLGFSPGEVKNSRSSGWPQDLGWLQVPWGQRSAPNKKGH